MVQIFFLPWWIKPINSAASLKIPNKQAGTEFTGHEEVAEITDADFYFAKPYRLGVRGFNEHTNGLIRQLLSKGTNFNEVSNEENTKI
ncbi:hypothetical protein [Candidatus Enterovibrio escicola]|uniref:hypothetical protein n=1 Tax=Candidatus Enterovibrio escicola TaxID=1927127 RepID=UPI0018F20267|nr:hypothetical protein [Candidatus Enterovibrio escacola]